MKLFRVPKPMCSEDWTYLGKLDLGEHINTLWDTGFQMCSGSLTQCLLLGSLSLTEVSVTLHFNGISDKKSHSEPSGEMCSYLSLRILQYNLHVFTSAPRVLVLPDEVSWRTGCDSSICSPHLKKKRHQSTQKPVLTYFKFSNCWDFVLLAVAWELCPAAVLLALCGHYRSDIM